jgi:uncharacterized protein (TIGR03437 family)
MKLGVIVLILASAAAAWSQPTVTKGSVFNGSTLVPNADGSYSPLAPGALVTIFGSFPGATQADADSVPFSTSLGGVSVTFNGVPAPMRDMMFGQQSVNAVVPFGVLPAGQTSGNVAMVVSVNGTAADPVTIPIVPQAPGVFTNPPSVGNAVLINLADFSMAAPVGSAISPNSHPIQRGGFAFFYVSGLGGLLPAVADGDGGEDGLVHNAVLPRVTVGGIQAQVLFAGLAAGSPGIYQVNIVIPQNAPTGDSVEVRVTSFDGTQSSPPGFATIAVQ